MDEKRVQRSLVNSMMIAPAEAISSVGLAIILIGLLAREGGLALVGQWVLLQSFVGIALAFDLGMTYGMSRNVATDGPTHGFEIAARASVWPLAIAALCGGAAIVVASLGETGWFFSAAVALAAGAVQLLSHWWSAVQTGAHRHVFTQSATIALNIAQFSLVIAILWSAENPDAATLALAILIARVLHLLLVMALLWISPLNFRGWLRTRRLSSWRAVWNLASGFTFFTTALKWRGPLLRLCIGFLGGDVALGVFSIAQRVPEAVLGVFSSGLQTMLPGFAGLRKGEQAARFVFKGLAIQFALCAPIFLMVMAHAPTILSLWIRSADADLVLMTRIMCFSGIIGALNMPFFWALQASGAANFMAVILTLQTALVIAIGTALFAGSGVLAFVAVFAALSVLSDVSYLLRAVRMNFDASELIRWFISKRIWLIAIVNIIAAYVSTLGVDPSGVSILELLARVAIFCTVSLSVSYLTFRPKR